MVGFEWKGNKLKCEWEFCNGILLNGSIVQLALGLGLALALASRQCNAGKIAGGAASQACI